MTKIYIYDEIGGNGITALNVVDELSKAEGDLEVHINSGGGSVSQGIAIYNAIKQYDGQVVVYVDGLAASIASIIAIAGDKLIMAEGSLMMVHEVWTQLAGNASDLRKEAEVLDKHTNTILDIYEANTPLSRDEIKQMLAAETWLTAEEALELGIADEIAGEAKLAASIDLSRFQNAPAAIENLIKPEEDEEEMNSVDKDFVARLDAAKARLATLTKLAQL